MEVQMVAKKKEFSQIELESRTYFVDCYSSGWGFYMPFFHLDIEQVRYRGRCNHKQLQDLIQIFFNEFDIDVEQLLSNTIYTYANPINLKSVWRNAYTDEIVELSLRDITPLDDSDIENISTLLYGSETLDLF